jgi:hypothetical protein
MLDRSARLYAAPIACILPPVCESTAQTNLSLTSVLQVFTRQAGANERCGEGDAAQDELDVLLGLCLRD